MERAESLCWKQRWNVLPSLADVPHQAKYLCHCLRVVLGVGMDQSTRDIAVEFVQVLCQLATFLKVKRALQANHNAACTR